MFEFDLVRVTCVRYVRDHVLWLSFSDGVEGEADLGDSLSGAIFAPLRDPDVFALVELDGTSIAWPNGADWAPESLHDRVLAGKRSGTRSDDDGGRASARQLGRMPEISRFFGVIVRMFYSDHMRPHFHAQHGDASIAIEIAGDGVRGSVPPSRLQLLFEWRDLHREELLANWERLRVGEPPQPIAPLE